VVIVIGLAGCFAVAGFIEGFVTPSSLPTSLRVGVGVAVLSGFVVYISMLGSRAVRAGSTGLLSEERRDVIDRAEEAAGRGVVIHG
jgi:hypothetical protein